MVAKKQTKNDWSDQYKHPKWQKRRLEILQNQGFKCKMCGDAEKTLNVHHGKYVLGRKIWEYEDYELIGLCEDCHLLAHEAKDFLLMHSLYYHPNFIYNLVNHVEVLKAVSASTGFTESEIIGKIHEFISIFKGKNSK